MLYEILDKSFLNSPRMIVIEPQSREGSEGCEPLTILFVHLAISQLLPSMPYYHRYRILCMSKQKAIASYRNYVFPLYLSPRVGTA